MRWLERMDDIIFRARRGARLEVPALRGVFDGAAFFWMWENAIGSSSVRTEMWVRAFPDIPEEGAMRIEISGNARYRNRFVTGSGYCRSFEMKMSATRDKAFSSHEQLMVGIGEALVEAQNTAWDAVDIPSASRSVA
ncbi:MAG: hypothetical protein Q7R73_01120 [bacterium]|nr:hypothetical protein [bacterium]